MIEYDNTFGTYRPSGDAAKNMARDTAAIDRAKNRFAVYPGDGSAPFLTDDRAEAVDLAHKTNGSWTRVPKDTVAADLVV